MTRTLTIAGAFAGRVPALHQPSLRRPILRLIRSETDAPFPPPRPPATQIAATRPAPIVAAAFDEEDAERWDGMA